MEESTNFNRACIGMSFELMELFTIFIKKCLNFATQEWEQPFNEIHSFNEMIFTECCNHKNWLISKIQKHENIQQAIEFKNCFRKVTVLKLW